MILSITVEEITFWNGNLIYVIRNVSFTFDYKKLLEKRAQICDRFILKCFAMLSRFRSVRAIDISVYVMTSLKWRLRPFPWNLA